MKRRMIILFTFLGSVVFLASCSKEQVTYSFTSQDFVNRASSAFNFQLQAANLAKSRGVNDSVKAYGTVIITADTPALNTLKSLAKSKGLNITATLLAQDQTNLNSLQSQNGTAFDMAYAQMMVLTHNQEGAFFNLAALPNGVADADLRNFSINVLPGLSLQLQAAYVLQSAVATKQ